MILIKIISCIIVGSAYIKGWLYWMECMDGFVDNAVFKVLWWSAHMGVSGWIMKEVFL